MKYSEGFPKKFPCGEIHVKVEQSFNPKITKRIKNSDDILEIIMAADALRRAGATEITLEIPYVPYSRQDRVMVPGESLSIKVFADLINSIGFKKVIIWDPHSDVTTALIDNCEAISQENLLVRTLGNSLEMKNSILVCPDAGARKKIHKVATKLGINQIIFADKVRDVLTGNIVNTKVDFDSFDRSTTAPFNFIIVDDICDGGRSFIEIAKTIHRTELLFGSQYFLHLYVTHGFFTQGLSELEVHFKTISCANLMNSSLVENSRVHAYSW